MRTTSVDSSGVAGCVSSPDTWPQDVANLLASLPEGAVCPGRPVTVARAPGRLDLMGGIADYSGALVLQWPIAEATVCVYQPDDSSTLTIESLGELRQGDAARVAIDWSDCDVGAVSAADAGDYAALRTFFDSAHVPAWARYVAGCLTELRRYLGRALPMGGRLLIRSTVPEAKGVSSSAAIEVATMRAIVDAHALNIDRRQIAVLCQRVENHVVGAPCGIMDQMAVSCGGAYELMALRCQPAELLSPVRLPDTLAVWGIDSGIRHCVGGADYTDVRVATFMGYRLILEMAGVAASIRGADVEDPRWAGYLANLTPGEFEREFAEHLPETLDGADFLHRFADTTDSATAVQPERRYTVRAATAHPVYENARVHRFSEILQGLFINAQGREVARQPTPAERRELGRCMYDSHASYSAVGMGSAGTDRLVELARELGEPAGILGAKITGGGSGGTVALLTLADAEDAVQTIRRRYHSETGVEPHLFQGSSAGARSWSYARSQ